MSLRQVLTIFNAERQLSDEETALLNTLRKMTDAERELLGGSLAPQAKPKPRKKRAECARCDHMHSHPIHHNNTLTCYHEFVKTGSKSARASSLREQIAGTATGQVKVELCNVCGNDADFQDHFKPSPNYHPFASSSSARSAAKGSSSKNGSLTELEVSTGEEEASVSSAAGD